MSQFSASIEFKFSSNFEKVAKSVNKNIRGMKAGFLKLQRQVKANQEGMQDFARFLKRGFLVGLAALATGFAIATVKAQEYDKALAQLSAITGLTGKSLEGFGRQSIEASNRFGVSAASYLEAVQLVASAKPELLEQPQLLKKITDEAAILSKAAGIDLASAANALTDSMNQFELGAADANRAINVLAAGSKYGASLVADTAQALVKSGVAAKLAGLNFEQANAAIQVLSQRGIKGAMAGTQLKGVFLTLNKVMSASGINDVGEALEMLSAVTSDATKMEQLFGRENITAASILIESRKKFADMTNAVTDTTVATEQARINMAAFGERLARLKQTLLNALMIAFKPFVNILGVVAEKVAAGLGILQKYPKLMTGLIVLFGLLTAALGALALGVTLVMMKATIVAFIAAAKAVGLFTLALLANPITLIVVGVVALIAALALLVAKWDNLRAALLAYANLWFALYKGIYTGLKMGLIPAWNEFVSLVKEAAEPFEELFNIVDELFGELAEALGLSAGNMNKIALAGQLMGLAISGAIQSIFFPLRLLLVTFLAVKDIVQTIGYLFTGQFDEASKSLKKFVSRGQQLLKPFIGTIQKAASIFGFGDEAPTAAKDASEAAGKSAAALEAQKVITKQSLDVNLKVDGPVKVEKVTSDNPVKTTIESGLMIPEGV